MPPAKSPLRRPTRPHRVGVLTTAALILIGTYSTPAQAQTSVQLGIDEGLRRQEERTREQQQDLRPHADVLTAGDSAAESPQLPVEQRCFVIDEIALLGPDVKRFAWLAASTDALLHRCIGAQGIARIAAYLDAQLIKQGYVTSRVAIGAQNLGSHRLEIQLHIGRIAEVRMVDARDKLADPHWGTWANAFPTNSGRILNARDLEQGVEQMKRLPSQNVATTLEPGSDPDTSILTIERQSGSFADRVRGGITLDNSGSANLGREQLSANLAFDNPLGLNDIVTAGVNGNAEHPSAEHRSQSASVNYAVPFGYSTFSAGYSHNRFAQTIQLTTTQTLSSGTSDTADLKWEHIAWRTAATKTGVYLDLSTRKAKSYLDDVELLTQHRQTTFIEAGLSFKELFANQASIDFALAYRRGATWLGAQDDLPPESGVTLRPHTWTLNAGATVPFGSSADGAPSRGWQYSVHLHAQSTHDRTTTIDQIAIGSRASVRGFDGDAVLIAESGWTVRNEVSTPIAYAGAQGALYLGLDFGRVWGPSAALLPGHRLAGAVLGLRGGWKAVQFDLALATPLDKPEGFKTGRFNPYASLSWVF